MSSETRDCEWKRCHVSLHPIEYLFSSRNIVTHHAEDGSGIGSAIIAGELPTPRDFGVQSNL